MKIFIETAETIGFLVRIFSDAYHVSRCKNYAIRNGVKMKNEDVLDQIQTFIDSSYTGSNATDLDLKKLYYAKYPDEKPTALNNPELSFDVSRLV